MCEFFYPRGIRNNNPGNIRHGTMPWQGQKNPGEDPEFPQFIDPVFGLRALMRLLLTYRYKYGLDTVDSLINRYAPPHENATDHYARNVAKALKVKRAETLDFTKAETLISLAAAIVRQENGAAPEGKPRDWYAPHLYDRAAKLALEFKGKDMT